jgi:hypothetical protein
MAELVSEIVLSVIVFLFAVAPVPATFANGYLWRAYQTSDRNERGESVGDRSWILRCFAVGATVVNLSSLFFGFLAVRRMIGADPLDWTPPLSAIAALALEVVPVYFAIEFHRRRRQPRRRRSDTTA